MCVFPLLSVSLLCHTERRPSAPCGYRTLLTVVAAGVPLSDRRDSWDFLRVKPRINRTTHGAGCWLGVVMFPGVINTIFMSGMMVRGFVFFFVCGSITGSDC